MYYFIYERKQLSFLEKHARTQVFNTYVLSKALQANLEKIIEHVESDDVIVFLFQEKTLTADEFERVDAEVGHGNRVTLN